ncbi:MAG: alpha/beta fold hydrolase [Pseudomonadota bacterium]
MNYTPTLGLRNPHVNTILASTAPRRWWQRRLNEKVYPSRQDMLLACSEGIRLHGEYVCNPDAAKGCVILLHGWEGCSESAYMQSVGRAFFKNGYSVFKLHLRDHGPSSHLNPEPFLAIRLAEVIDAIEAIHSRLAYGRYCLVGFSLGGNIALRVAANMAGRAITLERVLAVCPPIDPHACGRAISASAVYNRHFVGIWRASFRRKLQHYPELRAHEDVFEHDDILDLHEAFVPRFSSHPNAASYFRAYRLAEDVLPTLEASCHVLLAEDDPVIPVEDCAILPDHPKLTLELSRFGGHCGFLKNYRGHSWLDERLPALCDPRH